MGYSKFTKILVYITVITVILAGVYFAYSNKDNRQIYFNIEAKNFSKILNKLKNSYENFINNQKPYMNEPYNNNTSIYVNFDDKSKSLLKNILPVPFDITNIINKTSLVYNGNYEPHSGAASADISLVLEKTPIIEANIFTENEVRGILIPGLFPGTIFKYNEKERDQIPKYLDIPFIPMVIRMPDIAQKIYFNQHDLNKTMVGYGRLMSSTIKNEDIEILEDVRVKSGDHEIKGRKIIINLSEEKTKSLIEGIGKILLTEDAVFKITFGNIANIYNFMEEKGFNILFVTNKEETKTFNIEKEVKEFLEQDIKYCEFLEGTTINLVIDNFDNIVERTINLHFKYKTTEYVVYYEFVNNTFLGSISNNNCHMLSFTEMVNKSKTLQSKFLLNNIINESENDKCTNRRLQILYEQYEEEIEKVSVNADLFIEKDCNNNNGIQRTNTSCKINITDKNTKTEKQEVFQIPLTVYIETIKTPNVSNLDIPITAEYKTMDIGKLSKIEFEKIIEEALGNFGLFFLKALNF
jgi:hypothetical protein